MSEGQTPAGWYHGEGDPPGTVRYWDGAQWVGEPIASGTGGSPGPGLPDAGQFQPGAYPPGGSPPGTYGPGPFVATPHLTEPGSRIGGRLLDGLVWILILVVSSWPIISRNFSEAAEAARENRDPEPVDIGVGLAVTTFLINVAVVLAYEVFMNTRFGGTFGKKVTSSRIVKEDGSDLDNATALMRMVPYLAVQALGFVLLIAGSGAANWLPTLLLVFVGLVGVIMLFNDDRRQAPWDKVAKTIVVVR